MDTAREFIALGLLFVSLYFEIFMLITYLENRRLMRGRALSVHVRSPIGADAGNGDGDALLPGVTVIVPCFNEEKTVGKTLESLLSLDYPSDRLRVIAVNDGSKDGTAAALEAYAADPRFGGRLSVRHKENGGKHTALNLGIATAGSPFVGCLDSDSYATPDALRRIMKRFEDPSVMAVVPSLHIHEPSNLLQRMQKAEYFLGAFLRSILSELEAIYVTPGPLSMIRRSVFDQIGLYRKAHNTEDMEIAFRMQERGMKIVNAHDAIVHTSSPRSVRALYRQRVRWTSGFLFNLRDYRHMLGTMRYGNLGSFILPVMLVSTAAVLFIVSSFAYEAGTTIQQWYIRWQALGFARMFEWNSPNLDWFFMKTSPLLFGGLIATAIILSFILIGARISRGKRPGATDIACYAILYPFIVPWWVIRSLANLALSRQTAWR